MNIQPAYKVLFDRYDQSPFVPISEQTIDHEILKLTSDPSNAVELDKAELIAFRFVENYHDTETPFYKPLRQVTMEDGSERVYPDIKEVSPEMMAYWQYRAESSSHPVVKARYAGLVNEFALQVTGQKPAHTISRMFAQALLDTVSNNLITIHLYKVSKLERALSVALKLNDTALANEIKNCILLLEAAVLINETRNFWAFSFDLLIGGKKKLLTEEEETALIQRLEQRFAYFLVNDTEAAWEASKRLCTYYKSQKDSANLQRVLNELEAAYRSSFENQALFQKVHTLERIHKVYTQYGNGAKAAELLIEIRATSKDADREMKAVGGSQSFPQSEIDKMVNKILTHQGDQLFVTLAVLNKMKMNEIKQSVEESSRTNGLYFLLSKDLLDAKGRKIGALPPYNEDPAPYWIRQAEVLIKYMALITRPILDEGINRGIITVQEIMNYIRLSPSFETSNLAVVEVAIRHFVAGDYVAFICIIIPQLEEAVRNTLEKNGGNILIKKDDIYMLKTLDNILGDPIVVTKLGEPNCFHLKALLTEKTGMNLRNDVAHGYILPDKFDQQHADTIFAALLIFVLRTVDDSEPD